MPPLSVRIAKRAIDVVGSSVGICLTLPLYPAIAAAIRIDSPGGVFFSQRRVRQITSDGDSGSVFEEFTILKFRTMCDNAEKGTGAVIASKNDVRTTRIGRFLRKSRLDELPQLFIILIGDMSLVGPRPERAEILRDLTLAIPFFEERMRDVKPGLTGLAQVNLGYTGAITEGSVLEEFRSTLQNPYDLEAADGALADAMRAKLLFDLAYTASLENLSTFLATELRIIVMTPAVMMKALG